MRGLWAHRVSRVPPYLCRTASVIVRSSLVAGQATGFHTPASVQDNQSKSCASALLSFCAGQPG